MPKLYSARIILLALQRSGFIVISQKGSHIKLERVEVSKKYIVIVPNHKEVAIGTFSSILRQAGITKKEFEKIV